VLVVHEAPGLNDHPKRRARLLAELGYVALAADMADPADCAALAGRAAEALGGPVEILVYCAGISRTGRVADLALEDWNESMQVNVTGALQVSAGCIPAMSAAGWGRIVNILSLYSRFGVPTSAPYTVSKHALLGLTRVQSAELIRDGITVNGVVPGWVDTEMVQAEAQAVATAKDLPVDEVRKRFEARIAESPRPWISRRRSPTENA